MKPWIKATSLSHSFFLGAWQVYMSLHVNKLLLLFFFFFLSFIFQYKGLSHELRNTEGVFFLPTVRNTTRIPLAKSNVLAERNALWGLKKRALYLPFPTSRVCFPSLPAPCSTFQVSNVKLSPPCDLLPGPFTVPQTVTLLRLSSTFKDS